jgi:hypothetical protein
VWQLPVEGRRGLTHLPLPPKWMLPKGSILSDAGWTIASSRMYCELVVDMNIQWIGRTPRQILHFMKDLLILSHGILLMMYPPKPSSTQMLPS